MNEQVVSVTHEVDAGEKSNDVIWKQTSDRCNRVRKCTWLLRRTHTRRRTNWVRVSVNRMLRGRGRSIDLHIINHGKIQYYCESM